MICKVYLAVLRFLKELPKWTELVHFLKTGKTELHKCSELSGVDIFGTGP
jgi:hypothetical protein